MARSASEIRVQVSSYRYWRLRVLSQVTSLPEMEIVKLAIDDYFNRLLAGGAFVGLKLDDLEKVPEK